MNYFWGDRLAPVPRHATWVDAVTVLLAMQQEESLLVTAMHMKATCSDPSASQACTALHSMYSSVLVHLEVAGGIDARFNN